MNKKFEYKGIILEDGSTCSHCDQTIGLYRRKITDQNAKALLNMYRAGVEKWHHWKDISDSTDFAKIIMWGLIERKVNDNETKSQSGLWKLTYHGVEFIQGRSEVTKYLYVYNNTIVERSAENTKFSDCLDDEFDYREIFLKDIPLEFAGQGKLF